MAPRCGTSFILQQCVKAGLRVNGVAFIDEQLTPKAGNPEGYYEMTGLPQRGMVQKVWPRDLVSIDPKDISALVVLDRRDKPALFEAMRKQAEREQFDYSVTEAYEEISTTLKNYLETTGIDYLMIYTEELNDRIGEIMKYLETGEK